jgi:hypothetical protein
MNEAREANRYLGSLATMFKLLKLHRRIPRSFASPIDQSLEADAGVRTDAFGQPVENRGDRDLGFQNLEATLDVGQGRVRFEFSPGGCKLQASHCNGAAQICRKRSPALPED